MISLLSTDILYTAHIRSEWVWSCFCSFSHLSCSDAQSSTSLLLHYYQTHKHWENSSWTQSICSATILSTLRCGKYLLNKLELIFLPVQFNRSVMSNSAIPWTKAGQAFLSTTNSRSLTKLMSIKLVMPSNHLIFCCPLLLPPSIFPSIRVFSNESVLHTRWPNSGLISFRIH